MARPRRSRFTVTRTSGERVVVLAYGEDSARRVVEMTYGAGCVAYVERGDHRVKAVRAEKAARGGFTLDEAAIRDAADLLGLTWKVRVRTNARHGATAGNYRARYPQAAGFMSSMTPYHEVMVKSYATPEEATSTLWHELTHALQCEREGGWEPFMDKYRKAQRVYGYQRNPYEVEARQMQDDMAGVSLTR